MLRIKDIFDYVHIYFYCLCLKISHIDGSCGYCPKKQKKTNEDALQTEK